MARFIGIDYGMRRTGIAVTDPLGLISSPLKTILPDEVIPFLQAYTAKEEISGIAIGMPKDLQNKMNNMVPLVRRFTRMLHRYFPDIPLYYQDERFTSVIAKESLLASGVKKMKRRNKSLLDAVSASLILSSFLELHSRGKSKPLAIGGMHNDA